MAQQDTSDSPNLALLIFLAWLVPGLGHILLRRTGRGLMFAFLVFASLGLGLAHEGKLALRDPAQPVLTTLQVVGNIGVGPADFIARQVIYRELAFFLPNLNPDLKKRRRPTPEQYARSDRLIKIQRDRMLSGFSIYGTAYLWTAGIFNLLLLFDVWDIGRGRKP